MLKIIIFFCMGFLFLTLGCIKNFSSHSNVFSNKNNKVEFYGLLDSMDSINGWEVYGDISVVGKINSVVGKVGNALEIDFDFVRGRWFAVKKSFNKTFSKFRGIRFFYFWQGEKNSLEVKIEDISGTNYGYLIAHKEIKLDSWENVEIPFSKFKYFWGEREKFNFKKVKSVHFAVVRKDVDESTRGKVVIDNIELFK